MFRTQCLHGSDRWKRNVWLNSLWKDESYSAETTSPCWPVPDRLRGTSADEKAVPLTVDSLTFFDHGALELLQRNCAIDSSYYILLRNVYVWLYQKSMSKKIKENRRAYCAEPKCCWKRSCRIMFLYAYICCLNAFLEQFLDYYSSADTTMIIF